MNRFSTVVLAAAVLFLTLGCDGNRGIGVVEGDKLVVVEELEREKFDASYGESVRNVTHTNSAFIKIDAGTILEVFVTPRPEATTIEVRPVQAGDVTDADELTMKFVPERYRTHDFLYYTISLPVSYLGTKIKKME